MSAQSQYELLLDSGELKEMFPKLSGRWEKDQTEFVKWYEANIEAIRDIDVDFEDI